MSYTPAEISPRLINDVTSDTLKAASSDLEGGTYFLDTDMVTNQILLRGGTAIATEGIRILIYQSKRGLPEVASLKADINDTIDSPVENKVFSFGSDIFLKKGIVYVLWGSTEGGVFSCYVKGNLISELQTQNVQTGTMYAVYRTTIAANTDPPPATFDPFEGGADVLTPGGVDRALTFKLLKT